MNIPRTTAHATAVAALIAVSYFAHTAVAHAPDPVTPPTSITTTLPVTTNSPGR